MGTPLRMVATALFAVILANAAQSAETVQVDIIRPQLQGQGETLRVSGSVVAARRAALSVMTDGMVVERSVDIGSQVDSGQTLLTLDSALARIELARSEAELTEARANLTESRRLLSEAERLQKNNHVSENDVLTRRAAVSALAARQEAARANADAAREQVRRHTLVAPFSGVISARLTDTGEWVTRGTAVYELVGQDQMYVEGYLPQAQFVRIQPSTPVQVCAVGSGTDCVAADIIARVPVAQGNTRSFLLRVSAPDVKLLPGSSAQIVVQLDAEEQQTVAIPRDALLRHPDGSFSVFLVRDGRAVRQRVALAEQRGDNAIIRAGLTPRDRVVIRGQAALQDNQPVSLSVDNS